MASMGLQTPCVFNATAAFHMLVVGGFIKNTHLDISIAVVPNLNDIIRPSRQPTVDVLHPRDMMLQVGRADPEG